MRHRLGLTKAQPHQQPSPGDAAQHDRLAAAARGHQDHAAEGEGAAPRRRADHHARQEPDARQPRLAFDRLRDRDMVVKLFDELGPRYKARNGGYLRILKFGFRKGDNAPMALVELMDRPPRPKAKDEAGKKPAKREKVKAALSGAEAGAEAGLFLGAPLRPGSSSLPRLPLSSPSPGSADLASIGDDSASYLVLAQCDRGCTRRRRALGGFQHALPAALPPRACAAGGAWRPPRRPRRRGPLRRRWRSCGLPYSRCARPGGARPALLLAAALPPLPDGVGQRQGHPQRADVPVRLARRLAVARAPPRGARHRRAMARLRRCCSPRPCSRASSGADAWSPRSGARPVRVVARREAPAAGARLALVPPVAARRLWLALKAVGGRGSYQRVSHGDGRRLGRRPGADGRGRSTSVFEGWIASFIAERRWAIVRAHRSRRRSAVLGARGTVLRLARNRARRAGTSLDLARDHRSAGSSARTIPAGCSIPLLPLLLFYAGEALAWRSPVRARAARPAGAGRRAALALLALLSLPAMAAHGPRRSTGSR